MLLIAVMVAVFWGAASGGPYLLWLATPEAARADRDDDVVFCTHRANGLGRDAGLKADDAGSGIGKFGVVRTRHPMAAPLAPLFLF